MLVLPDAHAFGVVAEGAERRGAGGADPFLAALVAALLLRQALAQRLEQLVEAAHGLDQLLLLLGQVFLGELLEPLDRDLGRERLLHQFEAVEHVPEHAVELVEVALVLHQRGAREIVEVLDPARREIGLHRLHEREIFAQRHRHAGLLELLEEADEHLALGPTIRRRVGYGAPRRTHPTSCGTHAENAISCVLAGRTIMKWIGLLALGLMAAAPVALAQEKYPNRPIRLVVPSSPGGVHDIIGRLWAEKLKSLGTIVIENRAGAAAIIGTVEVSRAPADGYTLLLGSNSTHVLQPLLMSKPAYDPVKDFEVVCVIAATSTSIGVHPRSRSTRSRS